MLRHALPLLLATGLPLLNTVGQAPARHAPRITVVGDISSADREGIQRTLAAMGKAWTMHDMDEWGKYLTDDVQWINVVGQCWQGKAAVVRAHKFLHAGPFRNFSGYLISQEIGSVAPGVVLVTTTSHHGEMLTPAGTKYPAGDNRMAQVLVRQSDGRWLVRSAQNVTIDPEAMAHDAATLPMPPDPPSAKQP